MPRLPRTAWALAALSGLLQVLVFPSPALYWLGWVALAPLMVAVLAPHHFSAPASGHPATPAQGFCLGYLCGVLWYAGTCYWVFYVMHVYGGLATPLALGLLVLFCLYLGLYHGAFALLLAWAARRSRSGLRFPLLLAPFLWVALELVRARVSGFPWNLLGTSQVDNIPVARLAAFTGVYGISFELLLLNAAFAAALLAPAPRRRVMAAAALGVALLLQAGAFLQLAPATATHRALLVQQNIPILHNEDWTLEFFDRTVAELVALSLPPREPVTIRSSPALIIWPESPAPFYAADPRFRHELSSLARAAHAYVIAGSFGLEGEGAAHDHGGDHGHHAAHVPEGERPEPRVFNSASLVAPTGEWEARYDKIHLVPFGEYVPFQSVLRFAGTLVRQVSDFARGTGRAPFRIDGHTVGVFICYESIFPNEVREFARNGAQVFVNISNDGWFGRHGAPGQHLNMARMRAVENQRWILRATNTGVTASIDPYGRLVAVAEREQRAALQAPYAFMEGPTFYTRHGDWFAFGCAIIAAGALLMRFRFRKEEWKRSKNSNGNMPR
jgi:apolipoprotein N-acyltransferase